MSKTKFISASYQYTGIETFAMEAQGKVVATDMTERKNNMQVVVIQGNF